MTIETTKHVVIHTKPGDDVFELFRLPDVGGYYTEDLAVAKEAASELNKKHKPHEFKAYTLVPR